MKVYFGFQYLEDDAYIQASSDFFCLGLDCIGMLLAPLKKISEARELIQSLEEQEFEWWGEIVRIVGDGDSARIYTPMSYGDEHAVIDRETLKKVVRDWIHFIETRKPAEYEY